MLSLVDVVKARKVLSNFIRPTPLYSYPSLNELTGANIYVKHENYQPIGVFKIRGGINLLSQLTTEERSRGVITASTGNHGQSIAYAAHLFGVRAVVAVPENANRIKVQAIKNLGAEILSIGQDFDDCRHYCEQEAEKQGMRYVSAGDEPLLIAGVGTYVLEIIEELPDVDVMIVPVGGGSGAAGTCMVAKSVNPRIRVIAVQSSSAPAAYLTWKNRTWTESKAQTIAEGLATGTPFMIPQRILWDHLDDFLLVEDDLLQECVGIYLQAAKTLVEQAGAASLAAAFRLKKEIRDKKVALVLTGGNISPEQLRHVLTTRKTFSD